jgi:CelD/BcsL family acetyltransferase involved in cellulose biosynthesis
MSQIPYGAYIMTAGTRFVCAICTNEADLQSVRDEWQTLARKSTSHNAANSFDYVLSACKQLDLGAEKPCIVVVRRGSAALCIWPMYLQRKRGAIVARRVSGGSNDEYCDPLLVDDPDAEAATVVALKALRSAADAIILYNLKPHGCAARALEGDRGFKHRQSIECYVLSLAKQADFGAWAARKSRHFRSHLRQGRRWLDAKGTVRFRRILPDEAGRFVAWILARKQELVDANGGGENWTRSRKAHAFYAEVLARSREQSGVIGLVLELDGKIVAGCVCLISEAIEYFLTAYDNAYAKASPGALLLEEVAKFAIEQGKDLDLRFMEGEYKSRWSDRPEPRTTYTMALTVRGYPIVVGALVKDAIRRTRRSAARAIKDIRARWRAAIRSRSAKADEPRLRRGRRGATSAPSGPDRGGTEPE